MANIRCLREPTDISAWKKFSATCLSSMSNCKEVGLSGRILSLSLLAQRWRLAGLGSEGQGTVSMLLAAYTSPTIALAGSNTLSLARCFTSL